MCVCVCVCVCMLVYVCVFVCVCVYVCMYVHKERQLAVRGSLFAIRELEKASSREETVSFFSQNEVNNSAFDTVKHKNLMCTLYS